jgi:type II secretory pathway predicted ATPase ExeA
MYENFYGLKEKPFQIVPNPDYLFMSHVHENALTYLEYGLMENVGFILLIGEIGAGKTTLVKHIMDQFESEKEMAVIFNTNVTTEELICLILQAFDLEPKQGNKTKNIELFYQFLIDRYAQNKPVILIFDEAQNLSDEALEEVRMLSNLQSDEHHLLQVMLVGQPELRIKLQKPAHSPFAQRIAVNFFLSGLDKDETRSYIDYRLEKAGGRPDIFSAEAVDMIFEASSGIPRSINLLCDSALVYGFGYDLTTIDEKVIMQVIKDKDGMGINGATIFFDKVVPGPFKQEEAGPDRIERLEDAVQMLQRQMNTVAEQVLKTTSASANDNGHQVGQLKKLLVQERKRNAKLLMAYSQLKVKYDHMAKAHENNPPRRGKWLARRGSRIKE